jgi:hypothetical protein
MDDKHPASAVNYNPLTHTPANFPRLSRHQTPARVGPSIQTRPIPTGRDWTPVTSLPHQTATHSVPKGCAQIKTCNCTPPPRVFFKALWVFLAEAGTASEIFPAYHEIVTCGFPPNGTQ